MARGPIVRGLNLASSAVASALRPGLGRDAHGSEGRDPEPDLVLYEFEACPFCRKVREAICALDLAVDVRPCPKRGTRYRPEATERGGKAQFPYLVDRTRGIELYESDAIVAYLYQHYAPAGAAPPRLLRPGPLTDVSAALSLFVRAGTGGFARSSRAPAEPLELWSFEACPFCRVVRERLSALELPYRLMSVGKGSARRAELAKRAGREQVPFLVDPNTGTELLESEEILAYLDATYGA